MRTEQRARKRGKQGGKLTKEELPLQQSLRRGPQQITAKYNKYFARLGHFFQVGDAAAQNALRHTLFLLNTGLENFHQALSGGSKAREISKRALLGLSEHVAADTLNILGQLNKRLTSILRLAIQTQPQLTTPHRRKKKDVLEKDQISSASRTHSAQLKAKKRRRPDPLARGAWVRSKGGTSVMLSGSSTPRPARQASNQSSFPLTIDPCPGQPRLAGLNRHLTLSCSPCTCRVHVPASRHEPDINKHHSHRRIPQQIQEPDLLLASPNVFNTDYLPSRQPKVPTERPASSRKPRPPSMATILTASTKIGEIPEHKWLDRPALLGNNRPLPYVIPPPLEPEPIKNKSRGFKSWWRAMGE
jgi:hypothetical protein